MENKIKELIEKWEKERSCERLYIGDLRSIYCAIRQDLQSLLDFKQKNCGCANFIIEEVTHKQIESAAYDYGGEL